MPTISCRLGSVFVAAWLLLPIPATAQQVRGADLNEYTRLVDDFQTLVPSRLLDQALAEMSEDVAEVTAQLFPLPALSAATVLCQVAHELHAQTAGQAKCEAGPAYTFLLEGFLYQSAQHLFCNAAWAHGYLLGLRACRSRLPTSP